MFAQGKNRVTQLTRPGSAQTRLHTLHGLLRGRNFEGQFEAGSEVFLFSFTPTEALLAENRLVLNGRLAIRSPGEALRVADGVKARLVATQGGVGASPLRRQAGTAQTAQVTTPEQELEQEKGPETELQPGLHAFESPKTDELGRPTVESTGSLSFAGVLYFHLSPLDGSALGVPLDLSRVQLGGRLAPTDDVARHLQLLFSDLVATLASERPDEQARRKYLEELNRVFARVTAAQS